jgi:hypothetical protein
MLAGPAPGTVIRPSPYTRALPLPVGSVVAGQFCESGLASFLRAIGQAVRAAVSTQEPLCSIGTAPSCLRGVAAKVCWAR